MNAYRISIYDEGTLGVAQSYEAILLLQPAEQQTQSDTNHRTNHCNHSSLEEEDTRNLLVIGTQLPDSVAITQRLIEVACKVLQNSFQKYFCFDLMGKYFLFFSFIIL